MGLFDLATSLAPGRRRKPAVPRPGAPRTIVPVDVPAGLRAPTGATAPAGPLDLARLDAARDRLRREIAPVSDDE